MSGFAVGYSHSSNLGSLRGTKITNSYIDDRFDAFEKILRERYLP
jgi:hypothetical protein